MMSTTTTAEEEPQNQSNLRSLHEKLEQAKKEGDYYEAQQLIKTLNFRYSAKRRYKPLQSILINGAIFMLKEKQLNAAIELCLLLLQHYKTAEIPVNKESLDPLIEIYSHFGNFVDPVNRRLFIKTAISWSSNPSNNNQGAVELHNYFAEQYESNNQFELAQKHYLRGDIPLKFVGMLIKWIQTEKKNLPQQQEQQQQQEQSQKSDSIHPAPDIIVAKAVLEYLCLSNLKDANIIFAKIVEQSIFPKTTPLLQFMKYVLLVLERDRDAFNLFQLLRDSYPASLQRDPTLNQYLDVIGKVFFGVEPSSEGLGNILSTLMKSLFEGE